MPWPTPTYLRADRPITTGAEDRLQRAKLAEQLAERIVTYQGDRALVVGLAGRWGSGKTSFVNMVAESIVAKRGLRDGGEVLDPVVFTPWALGSRDDIARDLVAELGRAVGGQSGARTLGAELGPQLTALAASVALAHAAAAHGATGWGTFIAGLGTVPIIGSLLKPIADRAARRAAPPSLEEQFRAISKKLRDRNALLVVALDDLERLPADQVQGVFRVVGAIANFANTVYVLTMDRHRVARALASEYGNGHAFLEKFLHLTFDVPEADPALLGEMFVADLNRVLDARHIEVSDRRWGALWHGGLQGMIETPRDVVRVLNTFDMALDAVPADTDPLDLLGLEALRVCEPAAHRHIATHPVAVLRRYRDLFDQMLTDDKRIVAAGEAAFAAVIRKISPKRRKRAERLLGEIFPATQRAGGWIDEHLAHREHRATSPDHFDHFFRWSLAAGTFSERDLLAAVEALTSARTDADVERWVAEHGRRFQQLGDKLFHYLPDLRDGRFGLAASLLRAAHLLDDQRLLLRSDQMLALSLAYHLIKDAGEAWAKHLWEAVGNSDLLYGVARFYSMEVSEEARRKGDLAEPPAAVRSAIADAIQRRIELGLYDAFPDLGAFLFRWRDIAGDDVRMRDFVAARITSRDPLVWTILGRLMNVRGEEDIESSLMNGTNRQTLSAMFDVEQLAAFVRDAPAPPASEALVRTVLRALAPPRED